MKKIRVWGIKDLLSLSLSLLLAIILAMGSLQLQAEAATATEQNRANDSFQLGRPLVREMEVIITVSNDGNVTARGIQAEVPLPTVPDSPYQKLLAEHFDPKPQHIITDPSGSRRAIFYLGSLPRGEKLNIVINYLLLVYPIEYSLGKSSAAGSGYPGEALVYLE
ncbi:MAG: hypothetical protein GX764_06120, partial [Firmicutes bacterium]|nr:hypothetical protein [Bacillota bacterium]